MLEFVKEWHGQKHRTIDDELESLLEQMNMEEGHTERYKQLSENYRTLSEAKANGLQFKVVPAVISVSGTLLCVGLIMKFEKLEVITTKALQFVQKFPKA